MNVRKDNCAAAGLSAGGKFFNENVIEGSWGDVPYGCSIKVYQGDSTIYYNSDIAGVNSKVRFTSLCHELPVSNVDISLLYLFFVFSY